MSTNFYDKVVVKVKYKGNVGSGVLISDEKQSDSYMISAWHCFEKQSDIDYQEIEIFRQEENVLKKITLNFKDKIIIEHSDIIIFEIDYLEDIPQYQIVCPEIKEKVAFVGFPRGLSGEECLTSRYIMRGKINDFPSGSIIQVNSDRSFDTYISDAKNNMAGYSGCGLFVENEENPYLCGIINDLGSEEGLFSFVNGITIVAIDNVLYQRKGKHFLNIKWCDFNKYAEETLKIFDEPLVNICAVQIPRIVENVTPNGILEHCGNKIVWPYSNREIYRNKVWEEWLLYLIIRSIENRENLKNEEFYVIKNEEKSRKVKVLYATQHTTLPVFLKDYLEKAYQDISTGQVMIIKTNTEPAIKKLKSENIKKIVSDISNTISAENQVYIDDVESNIRQISIMHINALTDEMSVFIEQESYEGLQMRELEKKLGERIAEVLYGI